MKQKKLQTKLFLAYLSLVCLVLFSFAVFFYVFVSRQLIDSQIQALNTLNSSFHTQVDAKIRDMDNVSININYSDISKEILDPSFELNITYEMLSKMSELFVTVSGTELKVDQMNLYDTSGYVLQAGLSTKIAKNDQSRQEWIARARELEGSKLLSKPYVSDEYSKPNKYKVWYLSLYRSFNNQYGRSVGAVETVKRCDSIFKSIISYEKKNKDSAAKVYVFDEEGSLVYPYDVEEKEAKAIEAYYPLAGQIGEDAALYAPDSHAREYAASETSTYTNYTYMTILPEREILGPVNQLLWILFGVVAAILLVAVVISYRLSRSIVRPIKHLKHIIQRMELDTLGKERATSYPVSVNELEELYQAFQVMSDSLKTSMNQLIETQEQELKSRALALQSQMNPHFYYNSLASIMIMAENGDTDTVVKTCRNLSNIMRYITNTSSTVVTLREEIDYVQKYLYCMKVRYQSSLNYVIDVEESLLDERIPKLIIQPIVENAIKYGADCEPPWNIAVRGYRGEDFWQIDVTDSGNGFTDEAMEKIRRNIEKAKENPGMPELKINGLGTLNVYLRWSLFCKDQMVFTYGNTAEGHGKVSIGRRWKQENKDGKEQ